MDGIDMNILYIKKPFYVAGKEYEAHFLGFSIMNFRIAMIVIR